MARNAELAALQRELIGLVNKLSSEQERAQDPEVIIALAREITEVTHRATLVGQLLFKQRTAALSGALQKVDEGRAALREAIEEIDRLNGFLRAISRFLTLVDRVIDAAKLI
ncbi:MAG TPA: hypothetical protein VEA80_00690 [Vitreimonas sp.]|uniref:hypothetical protein n=1 Tax=Vitreimonas sp. TaxID=3069702 RepID=UPI002D3C1C4E|nr:hypothetical protein [Vitreimonas sp.]HYD85967.1 hypothetical protein [Vitreimonas sp.]